MVVPPSKERRGRVTRKAFCSVLMTRGVGVVPRQLAAEASVVGSNIVTSNPGSADLLLVAPSPRDAC